MKRIALLLALVGLYHIAVFGQKKYEMVVEKTDGTEIVVNTEEIVRTFFRERTDSDNNSSDPYSELVGIWTQYHQEYTTGSYLGHYIGLKLDANGEAAYTEWGNNATPNWTYTGGAKWSVSGGVLTIIAPNGSIAYSSAYKLSSDGKTITFEGDTTNGHFSTLKGEFIKQY